VTGRSTSIAPRKVAIVIWAAHLGLLALFLALVLALPPPARVHVPPELVLALAAATSALGIALSRLLPQRIAPRQAGGGHEAVAMTRLIVGWALCEGVAMFPLVTFLLARDARLLALLAVDVVALLTLYPSAERWAAHGAGAAAAPTTRMVR
jgi:hypothetical protein